MVSISQKESVAKSELKKRIMNIVDGSAFSLPKADLDRLSMEKLRNLYLIAKTMRIEKPVC